MRINNKNLTCVLLFSEQPLIIIKKKGLFVCDIVKITAIKRKGNIIKESIFSKLHQFRVKPTLFVVRVSRFIKKNSSSKCATPATGKAGTSQNNTLSYCNNVILYNIVTFFYLL